MNKVFLFILMAAMSLFTACSMDEDLENLKGNPDDLQVRPSVPDVEDMVVDRAVFDLLNLDYPGLEQVKSYCGTGDYELAAHALLEYYRNRVDVFNPDVVINPDCSADDLNRAAQATEEGGYRFYVQGYAEDKKDVDNAADDIFYTFGNKDGNIDWSFTPEGLEGDKEWNTQKHRLQWMQPQAKVYGSTKDEKYAEAWVRIIRSWKDSYKNHKADDGSYTVFPDQDTKEAWPWIGLQTAVRFSALVTSFGYYLNSEHFTPEWMTEVLMFMYDHMGNMLANPWHEDDSNIALTQQQAILYGGLYLPEFKEAAGWLDFGAEKITGQLTAQFKPDGVHNEFDLSYHLGAVADFVNVYKALKMNNKLNLLPPDYTSYLKNAALFVRDMVYPDYSADSFNDTRSARMTRNVILRNLKEYNLMFPEGGEFLYMSSARAYGSAPSSDLRLYPETGYYMFRSGWEENDMVLIHKNNNDPDNKWHNQPDNGTFCLYRNGRRFMPDAGVSSYGGTSELNTLRNTFAATGMHSTMNFNQKNIADRAGTLLTSGKNGNVEYLVTENAGYAELTHRRAIFFVDKKFFVIVDEGYSEFAAEKVQLTFALSDHEGASSFMSTYLDTNPYVVATNYPDGNNMLYKTFTSAGVSNYTAAFSTAYYLNEVTTIENYENDRIRRGIYRVTADKPADKAARFITVIHPISTSADIDALDIQARFTDNQVGAFNPEGASVEVIVGKEKYDLIYSLN